MVQAKPLSRERIALSEQLTKHHSFAQPQRNRRFEHWKFLPRGSQATLQPGFQASATGHLMLDLSTLTWHPSRKIEHSLRCAIGLTKAADIIRLTQKRLISTLCRAGSVAQRLPVTCTAFRSAATARAVTERLMSPELLLGGMSSPRYVDEGVERLVVRGIEPRP